MNETRRKALKKIAGTLDDLRTELEALRDEEDDAYNSMPDSLKQSDRGQDSEQSLDSLNSAVDSLGEAESSIDEAMG